MEPSRKTLGSLTRISNIKIKSRKTTVCKINSHEQIFEASEKH